MKSQDSTVTISKRDANLILEDLKAYDNLKARMIHIDSLVNELKISSGSFQLSLDSTLININKNIKDLKIANGNLKKKVEAYRITSNTYKKESKVLESQYKSALIDLEIEKLQAKKKRKKMINAIIISSSVTLILGGVIGALAF